MSFRIRESSSSGGWAYGRRGRGLGRCVKRISLCVVAGAVIVQGGLLLGAWISTASAYELVSGFGSFQRPEAVAFDPASHDVYVVDDPAEVVKRFNSDGKPAAFVATESYVRGDELTGTSTRSFNFDSSPSTVELAVDDSGGPASGDLYVTDSDNRRVEVFASSGSYLGEVNLGLALPESGGEPCGVAVDTAGNVYVAFSTSPGHIDRYTPVDGNPADDVFSAQIGEVGESVEGEVCQIAVDKAGGTYADRWSSGPLFEFTPTQFGEVAPVGREVDGSANDVAADFTNGHVFVDEGTHVAEYEDGGGAIGAPFGPLSESRGIGVDGPSGNLYVTESVGATVDVFMPSEPSAPVVRNEFAANVTSETVTLGAEVTPRFRDTHYFFRYGPDTSYTSGRTPVEPGADIGSGSSPEAVQAEAKNLIGGAVYHYQIVAENELGTTYGPDRTFVTPPLPGPSVLPDNRVWEQVSPREKNGGDVEGIFGSERDTGSGTPFQVSPDGDSITYVSLAAFGDAQSDPRASQYLSTRGPDGWSTQDITPPMLSASYGNSGHGAPYKAFSSDLSRGLLINGDLKPIVNPPLALDAPAGYQNYYLHSFGSESFEPLLTSTPSSEGPEVFSMAFEGATPDLSHVLFATDAALTPNTVDNGQQNVYEWANGLLEPVNVLPGGAPAPGAVAGSVITNPSGGSFEGNMISDDGSRVFWSYMDSLYVHKAGGSSVQIDASGVGGAGGGGFFRTASADGSRVFFTDSLRLTSDSTAHPSAGAGGEDLYMFDVETDKLTDITVDGNPEDFDGASVQGTLGASANGEYVYFVAKGALVSGAVSGEDNLYVWHNGEIRFIATLSRQDEAAEAGASQEFGLANDWNPSLGRRTVRVSPSGEFVVFMSAASLKSSNFPGGYDNRDLASGGSDEEVYLYDAGSGSLVCVSCNPSGGRPIGPSNIPAGTHSEGGGAATAGRSVYQPRVLSEDGGRVFFETADALVPRDTNGQIDVYEYEGGRDYLISGGKSNEESSFVDASANGSDVFFVTRQQLVSGDTDNLVDLYDAREGGGFPQASVPSSCGGEGCRPLLSQQPVFGSAPSAVVGASENLKPAVVVKHVVKKRKVKKRRPAKKHRGRGVARGKKAASARRGR